MDGALQSVFDRFWQWRLKEAPEFGTMIGEHGYDDELDDMSLNSYAKRLVCTIWGACLTYCV